MTAMVDQLEQNSFALSLSGGGALGYAHLGVLHDLEMHDLHPQSYLGTSMGGIIAACAAIGMKEAEIYETLKRFSAFGKWLKLSFSTKSLIETHKIKEIFKAIFKERTMMQTEKPLFLIATDLQSGERRIFTPKDNLYIVDVLLATIAVPGIFPPKEIGGRHYVDGFLSENLPIEASPETLLLASDVMSAGTHKALEKDTPHVGEILERTIRILVHNQTRDKLVCTDKQVIRLTPELSDYKTYHFNKLDEIREKGLGLLA